MDDDPQHFILPTCLSGVDPVNQRFVIRGHDGLTLAETASYEDAVSLLWGDLVPGGCSRKMLGMARRSAFDALAAFRHPAGTLEPVEFMRWAMAGQDAATVDSDPLALLALMGVAAMAWGPERGLLIPDPSLGHAEDLLRMATGRMPSPEASAAFEAYLVTMVDHGIPPSTFVARIVASTRAGLLASTIAALSALLGPLHGGAPSQVLDMLDQVGDTTAAEDYVREAFKRRQRLPGFGSRAYGGLDPRSTLFKNRIAVLSQGRKRLKLAEAMEAAMARIGTERHPDRPPLQANVELYAAILLEAVGLDRKGFTPAFAAARAAGWIAHALEQSGEGRLIRPHSRYIGPTYRSQ